MRLVAFEGVDGERLGIEQPDGVISATPWSGFDELFDLDDPIAALSAVGDDLPSAEVRRLLPPTVKRPQVIGTGGNYADHVAEASVEIKITEPVFVPFLWGAVIGPDDEIVIPNVETLTDYEVELAVVIGRTARGVSEEDAMDYVFGYTIVNDVSARNVTAREKMQMMLSKSVDTFLPIGPRVVTRDEIPDPQALGIRSRLNGQPRQESVTSNMAHSFARLIADASATVTLHPGDILTGGTPGGVGYFRVPPEFARPGDTITVEVDGVGTMTNRVIAGWDLLTEGEGQG